KAVWGGDLTQRPDTLYLSGDIWVEAGDTLELRPGTVVRVAPDHEAAGPDPNRVEFTVRGTLRAVGTAAQPIVFESFADTPPARDDWVGIVITSTSVGSELKNVVIRNAQVGVETFADIRVDSVRIEDCESGVINWADSEIRHSKFDNITDYAVLTQDGSMLLIADTVVASDLTGFAALPYASQSTIDLTIRDCIIDNCTVFGVHCTGVNASLTMRETTVSNAAFGVVTAVYASIESCLVKDCGTGLSHVLSDAQGNVRETTFEDNTTGVAVALGAGLKIEATEITGNTVGVYCQAANPVIKNSNVISLNDEGIKCDLSSDAVVESTTVSLNGVGIVVMNGSDPDVGHVSGGSSEGYNFIHHNTSYHIENLSVGVTVMAENNFWKSGLGPLASKFFGSVDYDPWLTQQPQLVSGGSDESAEPVPSAIEYPVRYELSYGYPNPFNPVVGMSYSVPAPGGHVQIVVYDVQGKVVARLVDGPKTPGLHRVTWEGRDTRGSPVASGVYFVKMSAVRHEQVRKIILVK
ncbi:MAG: right-handed parallel beta-helix repeat-containing protein, partial [Candidatus Krumholzibacteriota bacterium]|nr:right-handed parallel beta-helix repeat-containing protein [Candidatus Krumholzibacteriota bacterium]